MNNMNNKNVDKNDRLCGLLFEFVAADPEVLVRFPALPDISEK
jgi:hypothetical protein